LKEAAKKLSRFQAANDYAVAWVVQQSLGGHAIPVDASTIRVVRRLGLIDDDQENLEAIRASLEHLIPKARGTLFCDLVSTLAREVCWADHPNCPNCPLRHECATGQQLAREDASRTTRKPR
jgi:endonuclease-3